MKSVLKTIIFSIFLSAFALSAQAQIPTDLDGIEVTTNPTTPAPGQHALVKIESYITNLNGASIVWLVNGKNVAQGTGLTSIEVTAPESGKTLNVSVVIMTVEGKEIKKSLVIKALDVDLIWESLGYVPPLFKGKSLFSYQNVLKITAFPHFMASNGKEIPPSNLVYKWEKNDKVVQDQSGYGKQTLTVFEELPRPIEIEVTVTTKDGSEQAKSSVTLEPGDPSILFYEDNPLYGVLYNKSLGERTRIQSEEISILATPYSFSKNSRNSSLQYTWSLNNLAQPDLSTNQNITLRTREGVEGSSNLSLEIRNSNQILQGAKKSLTLLFNNKAKEEVENITF